MNTKPLIYFLKTCELGSIAAAARQLDIAQPSISQQIANLEHTLGSLLFERDHRGVRLTEAGEKFRRHAEAIVRQVENAKQEIRQIATNPSGKLAIGMTQPIGNIIAVPLLGAIQERYPNVEIDIYTGLSYSLVKQLKSGEIDLLIASPDGSDFADIIKEILFKERIFLAIGRQPKQESVQELLTKSQIRFAELANYDVMVTNRQDSLGYMLHQYEQKTGVTLKHKPPYGQLMTTLRYVSEGYGLLISPSSAFYHLQLLEQIHALDITEPTLWRDVYLARSLLRPDTSLSRAVRREICAIVRSEHAQGHWQGELSDQVLTQ